jgi:hypothetical protein
VARPDDAELLALVKAEAQVRTLISSTVATQVASEVRSFDGWYSHPEIREWTARLAKLVRASQRQTALSSQTYTQRVLAALLGRRPSSAPLVDFTALRGGVPLEDVYGRLADQYRYLSTLDDLDTGTVLERVVDRAERQTQDNLDLSWRQQFHDDVTAAPRTITGYRRVIHPELPSEPGRIPGPVCGLCISASTRLYRKDELLPLHNLCRCSVLPVKGDSGGDGDPGLRLNQGDLDAIYKAAGGTGAFKLSRVRYAVVRHDELGPQLVDVTRDRRRSYRARRDSQHAAS